MLLLMAVDSSSAKMSDANLRSLVGVLSIPGNFFGIQRFHDGIDSFRCYFRTPTGRRHRNGTGLQISVFMDFYNTRVISVFI